jgi:hypothetical protein
LFGYGKQNSGFGQQKAQQQYKTRELRYGDILIFSILPTRDLL